MASNTPLYNQGLQIRTFHYLVNNGIILRPNSKIWYFNVYKETVAILGGTGDLGTGLAIRWSKAGYNIVIGSRTLDKAQAAVEALQAISPDTPAQAMENGDAAAAGDIVVLTVPAAHQISTLDALSLIHI